MPIHAVHVSGAPDLALSAAIASALTHATSVHLHKDPEVTAVVVDYVPADHWFIGGKSLTGHSIRSFSLEIRVTHATNTKAEMANYLDAVFQSLGRLLGSLHPTSYIVIHEVPAVAWGFGGKTQEYRFIAGRLAAAG